jgi:NAD(P)H dehydrogenase (quinone)
LAIAATMEGQGKIHVLTGPHAHTLDEIAVTTSAVWDVPIRYAPCPPADYLRRLWDEMDDPWPHAFSTLCASVAGGRYGQISHDLAGLIGRQPEAFAAFVRRSTHRGSAKS